jgi:hypothetical protein
MTFVTHDVILSKDRVLQSGTPREPSTTLLVPWAGVDRVRPRNDTARAILFNPRPKEKS